MLHIERRLSKPASVAPAIARRPTPSFPASAGPLGDTAAAVIDGTVLQHDAADHVTTVSFAQGLPPLQLVSPVAHTAGEAIRLRIQARDVSLALTAPTDTSILNILPATVMEVGDDSPGQRMVALNVGTTRLLARVTQRSAQALALAPGKAVFAQVKGIAIVN